MAKSKDKSFLWRPRLGIPQTDFEQRQRIRKRNKRWMAFILTAVVLVLLLLLII
ncbi:MAG: hypothetical protein OXQ86_09760 [Gammaproteobacteria bacterium]|nr:hypothetical protein [Gammaproteobacteria bacterium]MDE0412776.1 hypothetical protein [Gammaproteobacteria bacterium]